MQLFETFTDFLKNKAINETVVEILYSYDSIDNAYVIEDYPYGRLRTQMFVWIESNPKKGDRYGHYTIDPKSGRKNKPKYSTYHEFAYLYKDEKDHVQYGTLSSYDFIEKLNENLKWINDVYGINNVNDNQFISYFGAIGTQFVISFSYWIKEVAEDRKDEFRTWGKGVMALLKSVEKNKQIPKELLTLNIKEEIGNFGVVRP